MTTADRVVDAPDTISREQHKTLRAAANQYLRAVSAAGLNAQTQNFRIKEDGVQVTEDGQTVLVPIAKEYALDRVARFKRELNTPVPNPRQSLRRWYLTLVALFTISSAIDFADRHWPMFALDMLLLALFITRFFAERNAVKRGQP